MNYATQNYLVKLFKILSNSKRLQIVHILSKGKPLSVTEIADSLKMEQSTLSNHLTRMRDNKVINAEQRGMHMYYSLSDPNVSKLLKQITPV